MKKIIAFFVKIIDWIKKMLGLGLGTANKPHGQTPAGGGGGIPSMADIVASAVADYDATNTNSYSGSGNTWANMVAAPADGSEQTAYDLDITNVDFTGTAGDAAAHMKFDGTGGITLATVPDFIKKINQTSKKFTFCFVATQKSNSLTELIGIGDSNNALRFYMDCSNNRFGLYTEQSTDGDFVVSVGAYSFDLNSEIFFAISVDIDADTQDFYIQNAVDNKTVDLGTGTSDIPGTLYIGANQSGASPATALELKAFSIFNDALDAAEIALVRSEYETRTGLDLSS